VPFALRSPRLRRIIIAYAVNRLGTWFGLLALVLAVFDHTHSALAVAALLFVGQALPALLVPAVVARVEASSRNHELTALYMFEAIVTTALAVLLWSFWLPGVLVLVALDGTAALAASALLRSEVARAAREATAEEGAWEPDRDASEIEDDAGAHAERQANAALNIAFSTTFVLGPAIGGVVVAAAGAPTALFIDVGSFLLGAALLADLHPHVENAAGDTVRARLQAARDHIRSVPMLRQLFTAQFVALLFIESGAPIEVTFVKATLHGGDRGVGLLLTMWGAGAVLGSVLFARLVRWPLGPLLAAGTLGIGAAYLGLAAAPSLTLACVAGLVGGVGNGLQWPSMISAVQKLTPDPLQGRMMGAAESLGSMCIALGLPLGGALVALSSPRTAFIVVGTGAVLTTVAMAGLKDGTAWPTNGRSGPDMSNGTPPDLLGVGEQAAEHAKT
jgi:MFS family permease